VVCAWRSGVSTVTTQKIYAPFGREVARILNTPEKLNCYSGCNSVRGSVWVATGPEAWSWREAHSTLLVIVLPAAAEPADFRWDFLAGHEPILICGPGADDTDWRRVIGAAMIKQGVKCVIALRKDDVQVMRSPDYKGADYYQGGEK